MVEGNFCFKIKINTTQYKIKPGVNNGIKIILNAETFDNGNPGTSFKGFRILVVDTEEGPPGNLMDMYGTTISTGSALKMSITSKIFKITETARNRFNSDERKCIYNKLSGSGKTWPENQEYITTAMTTIKESAGLELPYTLKSCLTGAAFEIGLEKQCPGLKPESYWHVTGKDLGCYNQQIGRMGQIFETTATHVESGKESILKCQVTHH